MILALLLQIAAPAETAPKTAPETAEARFDRCTDLATTDSGAGASDASAWLLGGGGFLARQCLGIAYATGGKYAGAGGAFEEAARAAEVARDRRSANYWAQAGNAWLAAGDSARARAALDAALASGTLGGLALGEAHLDRARAAVAAGNAAAARGDIDLALKHAEGDPLAWLLSATLARRDKDLRRAQRDIAEALGRAPDDAAVQFEAGNIAALAGDEAGARGGWARAVQLARGGPVAASASAALAQFDAGK